MLPFAKYVDFAHEIACTMVFQYTITAHAFYLIKLSYIYCTAHVVLFGWLAVGSHDEIKAGKYVRNAVVTLLTETGA